MMKGMPKGMGPKMMDKKGYPAQKAKGKKKGKK